MVVEDGDDNDYDDHEDDDSVPLKLLGKFS